MTQLEIQLEHRCVTRIYGLGGMALKLELSGMRGFPDRTILMPGAKVWFAEFKRIKSGRISTQQVVWQDRLLSLGFGFYFINTDEQFEIALAKETAVAQEV